ncbi:hypothetical protein D915_011088 [Fasciola hepatica]|uniref:Uncharacterized protein n=1 Tax=Fasciola hepatica TaxID=6192 RepID=A0A4E0QTV4_FASHE|nr:hypothetical protein D915_011088 [Fasciola hepatica]
MYNPPRGHGPPSKSSTFYAIAPVVTACRDGRMIGCLDENGIPPLANRLPTKMSALIIIGRSLLSDLLALLTDPGTLVPYRGCTIISPKAYIRTYIMISYSVY